MGNGIKVKDRAAMEGVFPSQLPSAGKCKKAKPDSNACNAYAGRVEKWWDDNVANLTKYVDGDINTVQSCTGLTKDNLGGGVRPWTANILQRLQERLYGCKSGLLAAGDKKEESAATDTETGHKAHAAADIVPVIASIEDAAPTLEPVPDITVETLGSSLKREMSNVSESKNVASAVVIRVQYGQAVLNLRTYVSLLEQAGVNFSETPSQAGGRSAAELVREIKALPSDRNGWVAEAQKRVYAWEKRNQTNLTGLNLYSDIDEVTIGAQYFEWSYLELIRKVQQKRTDSGQDTKIEEQDKKNVEQDAQMNGLEKKKEPPPPPEVGEAVAIKEQFGVAVEQAAKELNMDPDDLVEQYMEDEKVDKYPYEKGKDEKLEDMITAYNKFVAYINKKIETQ